MQPVPTTFPIKEGIFGHLHGMEYEKAVKEAFKIEFHILNNGDAEEVASLFRIWMQGEELNLPNNWDLIGINTLLETFAGKPRASYNIDERLLFLDVMQRAYDKSIPPMDRFIYDCLFFDLARDSS